MIHNTQKVTPWIILCIVFLLALGVIFYFTRNFSHVIVRDTTPLVIPKKEYAVVEINFNNGSKRVFRGLVKKETYPLDDILTSIAADKKFNVTIRQGKIETLAGLGGTSGSWRIYKNGEKTNEPLNLLAITGGDHYTFRFEK